MSKSAGEQIDDMQEIAVPVRYQTMQRNCEGLADWLLWKGVVTERHGMVAALEKSSWVAFKKSFYDGIPCYFVDWSGIEFIWNVRGCARGGGNYDSSSRLGMSHS